MQPFNPSHWESLNAIQDITYQQAKTGTVIHEQSEWVPCILQTVDELLQAFEHARTNAKVGCVILTEWPIAKRWWLGIIL